MGHGGPLDVVCGVSAQLGASVSTASCARHVHLSQIIVKRRRPGDVGYRCLPRASINPQDVQDEGGILSVERMGILPDGELE
jgi:hypothetical protein